MNYNETLNYIHSLENFGLEPTLDRIKNVLKKLGNPQNDFPAVHIAGTNGKGSVSAMLHSIFKTAGKKTGLFISPFIIDFCERIQINGEFIPSDALVRLSQKVIDTKIKLTQFEFITAVAFLWFSEQKCDIAVIETGLGGRLDATNSLTRVLACVITKIGLDHTAVLGDSIEQITKEKCGIIKEAPVIISGNQPKEALQILKQYEPVIPNEKGLTILKSDIFGNRYLYDGCEFETALSGEYQIENSLIAIETAKKLNIPLEVIKNGIKTAQFPARMEVISQQPLVVLDGAHNPDGAQVLSRMMENYKGKITAVIGMCKDKNCEEVLAKTLPYCKRAVAVEVKNFPRALKSEDLKIMAQKYCPCEAFDSYENALESIKGQDVIFVFGSLYLASDMREKLKNFFKR
ncbi:MAG: bifunctional folylpolyglutamate synthase/dihydrofolate synthase [Ruminococcaceae bacterium]|nr:bifunctional folylpolyglutamate synthase/dihydrofolate synthase [Oscillospiraceae bacterium]